MGRKKKLSQERVLEELVAIGFARVTDYLYVQDGQLLLRPQEEIGRDAGAAIASIECTNSGVKVKFYDKLKVLELLGKHLGMFDGKASQEEKKENNLLEAILAATQEEVDITDLPEIQQTAESGHDLVEPAGAEQL